MSSSLKNAAFIGSFFGGNCDNVVGTTVSCVKLISGEYWYGSQLTFTSLNSAIENTRKTREYVQS